MHNHNGGQVLPDGKRGADTPQGVWQRLVLLLAIGLLLRLVFITNPGYEPDLDVQRAWALRLTTHPLADFYNTSELVDHLPGDLWVLWGVTRLYRLADPGADLNSGTFLALLKLAPLVADVIIGWLLFLLGARLAGQRAGLIASALYLFNPASIFLTGLWGQWDSLSASFALVACWLALSGRGALSLPTIAYAALIKPQFIALAPVLLLAYLRGDVWPVLRLAAGAARPLSPVAVRVARPAVVGVAAMIAIFALVPLPFGVGFPGTAARWTLVGRIMYALNKRQFVSNGAFNLWTTPVASFKQPDTTPWLFSMSYQSWGTLLFLGAYALILSRVWFQADARTLPWAALATTFALFMLPTRGHERYMLPVLLFLCAIAATRPRLLWLYVLVTITFFSNLYVTFGAIYSVPKPPWMFDAPWFIPLASLVNLLLLAYTFAFGFTDRRSHGGPDPRRTALSTN